MIRNILILIRGFILAASGLLLLARLPAVGESAVTLLNVSYDPTRELYKEFNEAFARHWKEQTGQAVEVMLSNGGSGSQGRAVQEGLDASVVTLALAFDIDALAQRKNLLPADWQKRLPNHSCPYTSTIVFLVRNGNPRDQGLGRPGQAGRFGDYAQPQDFGGARWNYLAAWGYVLLRELGDLKKLNDPKETEAVAKAQEKARALVTELYRHVPVLDTGARGSTMTFVQHGKGDVLLAWENEALLALHKPGGEQLEMVAPSVSILAEPPVPWSTRWSNRLGTRTVSRGLSAASVFARGPGVGGQALLSPSDPKTVPKELLEPAAKLRLFTVEEAFGGWQQAQKKAFRRRGRFRPDLRPADRATTGCGGMQIRLKKHSVLPAFGLTMGFTLLY